MKTSIEKLVATVPWAIAISLICVGLATVCFLLGWHPIVASAVNIAFVLAVAPWVAKQVNKE